jgi:chromosome segregation ATPase
VPDSPNLSSALGEAVSEGRQFLTRVESLAEALSTELAGHAEAGRQWDAERQKLRDDAERLRGRLEAINATLAELRQTVHRAQQEREQVAADRDRLRQTAEAADREVAGVREKLEAAEMAAAGFHAQLATTAAETARLREQLGVVARDRDALQTDQIQWGIDRERLLVESNQTMAHAGELEKDLTAERELHEALQGRHAELTEQANKVAADWVARRQALAAEISAQNEEMQEVRKALEESQERERRGTGQVTTSTPSLSPEQSHVINSRLNALVGFSSVLLDERAHAPTVEERREYLKYLHDSAVKLSEAIRSLTGSRASSADATPTVDREGRPPDILVADNDVVSRQRIEPFLKRAGYEVVYVDNGPRILT